MIYDTPQAEANHVAEIIVLLMMFMIAVMPLLAKIIKKQSK